MNRCDAPSRAAAWPGLLPCMILGIRMLWVEPAAAEPPISLAQAQAHARQHAPDAQALFARVHAAAIVADDAERVFRNDPVLELRAASSFDAPAEREWGAGLDWTLDVSGAWGPRGAHARAAHTRLSYERAAGLRALDEAVATAVAELAFAQRQQAHAERIVALQQLVADALQRQLELGQINQPEADGGELELAAARSAVARARGARELVKARLSRLLGRELGGNASVEDPSESSEPPADPTRAALIERAPEVLAASAEARSAEFELQLAERLAWPMPTLGVELARAEHHIPGGAFAGAVGDGGVGTQELSARWSDWQVLLKLSVPLPLVDRNGQARAQANARVAHARAALQLARADARAQLLGSSSELRSALAAYRALEHTPALIERGHAMLEQTVRAGALDSVAHAHALRRLIDAASLLNAAVRDLRIARARWLRHSAGL